MRALALLQEANIRLQCSRLSCQGRTIPSWACFSSISKRRYRELPILAILLPHSVFSAEASSTTHCTTVESILFVRIARQPTEERTVIKSSPEQIMEKPVGQSVVGPVVVVVRTTMSVPTRNGCPK